MLRPHWSCYKIFYTELVSMESGRARGSGGMRDHHFRVTLLFYIERKISWILPQNLRCWSEVCKVLHNFGLCALTKTDTLEELWELDPQIYLYPIASLFLLQRGLLGGGLGLMAQNLLFRTNQGWHEPRQVRRVGEGDRGAHIGCPKHSRNLTRDELLLHLLGECILECEVVPPVYEQLVLQVLRGMEIFARGLLAVTPALNTVIASRYPPVLNFNIGRGMGKLALCIRAGALLPLKLSAHLQLKPSGVLLVQQGAHVKHGQRLWVHVWRVRHNWRCCHGVRVFFCFDSESPLRNL